MSNYEFNAPTFRSFTELSDNEDDQFFFEAHEGNPSSVKKSIKGGVMSAGRPVSPNSCGRPVSPNSCGQPVTPNSCKTHGMVTRLDVSTYEDVTQLDEEMLNRSIKRGSLKRTGSPMANQPSKFISLAENIFHFQKDTPDRFRTKKAGEKFRPQKYVRKTLTVPQTPQFLSEQRIRCCEIPTQEERELQEIEEYQKHKVLPHKVNRKVLEKKFEISHTNKYTVPEPFNLSTRPKKEKPVEVKPFIFKAQPVPEYVINGSRQVRLSTIGEEKENQVTKIKPFSFDYRDEVNRVKKRLRIEMVLEKEQHLREFRARPLPRYIYNNSARSSVSTRSRNSCI